MDSSLTPDLLDEQNQNYQDTLGVSKHCEKLGYQPAFQDTQTGETQLSRFGNGQPAPVHLLDGLPDKWIIKRDSKHHVVSVKASIIAGFLLDGVFYTREQLTTLGTCMP